VFWRTSSGSFATLAAMRRFTVPRSSSGSLATFAAIRRASSRSQ